MKYIDNGSIKYTNLTLPAWTSNTFYPVGSMVLYNNSTYTCIEEHTSGQTLDNNKWSANSYELPIASADTLGGVKIGENLSIDTDGTLNAMGGIEDWEQSVLYTVGKLVVYDNKIYKCSTEHTSSTTFDNTKWTEISAFDKSYVDTQLNLKADKSDTYTKSEIDSKLVSAMRFKGTVANVASLPTGAETGDVYNVADTGANYAWDGTQWDKLSENIDLSGIYTKTEVDNLLDDKADKSDTYTKTEIDELSKVGVEVWKTNTLYKQNNVVIYDNKFYKCKTQHTSSTFSNDIANWDLTYSNICSYEANKFYAAGSLVIYDNKIYKCLTSHTWDGVDLDNNQLFFAQDIITYPWQTGRKPPTPYVVTLTGNYFVSTVRVGVHGSGNSVTNFTIAISDDNVTYTDKYNYNNGSAPDSYTIDAPVNANAKYVRITVNALKKDPQNMYSGNISTAVHNFYVFGNRKQIELVHVLNPSIGVWTTGSVYEENNLVVYNGDIYRCTTKHTSGSSFDTTKWQILGRHDTLSGYGITDAYTKTEIDNALNLKEDKSDSISWKASTTYSVGDNVTYQNKIYSCVTAHTSTTTFDSTKWQQLVVTAHPLMWDNSNNLIPV